ncbi:unnamed protein product [Brassica napus]|uniref:(rape) hypothetical protein n=1 Tax=Brassica napus TaxID=3708 RepID=A0A816YM85_BRANA|nr:unnamed protein product [Brassica napus]
MRRRHGRENNLQSLCLFRPRRRERPSTIESGCEVLLVQSIARSVLAKDVFSLI